MIRLFALVLAPLVICLVWFAASVAQAQQFPPGSWRQSCFNPRMSGHDDFTAECRTRDGRVRTSKIDIDRCGRGGPVANSDGNLVCERQLGNWSGNDVPPGSYRRSCRNEHLQSRDDLVADCQRNNGNWRSTKIDIDKCRGRDIANDNGHLVCGDHRWWGNYGKYQMPGGSWQQTCRNAVIRGDDLYAECRQRDGDWVRANLDLDDCRGQSVHNDNGRLRCGGQYNQGGGWNNNRMPGGSWTQSCRNAQIRGDDLYAQCRDRKGDWRNTRIDLDRCPGRALRNDDGELRCT